jgi:hypothetical protein
MILNAMVTELGATQAQIQRILQSKAFRTSEVHRNLLSYLAEKSLSGTADSLKEYTVGLDVFAKPSSYDPRQESTVRMHVARLRQKLGDYYRTEGVDDPIFVDLPKGGFKVTFEPREPRPDPAAAEQAAPAPEPRGFRKEALLAAALLVAVACAGYLGVRLWQIQKGTPTPQVTAWTPELEQIWEPLIASKRPLIVCLSIPNSPTTEAGTSTGAYFLGQFLGSHKSDVLVTRSDQIEAPEVAMGNVIFLGPVAGNRQMQAMSAGRPFVLEPGGIRNMNPQPGEPSFFADKPPADPQDTEESYALISRVPGLYGNGEVLYLSGNRISSITGEVEAFTGASFAKTLVSKMRKPDGSFPAYYQVVLKVRSMDDMPIDVTYVLHRDLSPGSAAKPAENK